VAAPPFADFPRIHSDRRRAGAVILYKAGYNPQGMADFFQTMQSQGVSKAEPITVGGLEGRSIMLQSPSPFPDSKGQPQQERDWLITVPQRDGAVIYMIFVAPEGELRR